MTDEKAEVIILSSDDESKPKVVTSPKLSLKRRTPHKSEDEANIKKIKMDQPEVLQVFRLQKTETSPSQAFTNEVLKQKEYRKRFLELLEYSKSFMEETSEEEKNTIVKRMTHLLNSLQVWYTSSKQFKVLVDSAWKEMKANSSEVFNILFTMRNEMKKYKCKLKGSSKNEQSEKEMIQVPSKNMIFNGHGIPGTSKEPVLETNRDCFIIEADIDDKSSSSSKSHSSVQRNGRDLTPSASISLICENSENSSEKKLHNFTSIANQSVSQKIKSRIDKKSDLFLSMLELNSSSSSSPKTYSVCNDNAVPAPIATAEIALPQASTSRASLQQPLPQASTSQAPACSLKEGVINTAPSPLPASSLDPSGRNAARIKKLEDALAALDKAIKKCQQKELSLDDLDNPDSYYMRESLYIRRFNLVYKKLCELKKTPARTGRIIEKKFRFEGSRYRVLNSAIEKLINKKKAHEKFPDYSEVLKLVRKVNDENAIGLNEREILTEAERIFKDVGQELQIRRCRDEEDLFGCYLTDNFNPAEDPAEKDEELRARLAESSKRFETTINEIIDKYADKQREIGNVENEERDSQEEDDEEEKDDDEEKYNDGEEKEDDEEKDELEKVNEDDSDLPVTEPNSPELGVACKIESSKDDIYEIIDDSDKSTDLNDEIGQKIVVNDGPSTSFAEKTIVKDAIVIEDSESSDDLPSLSEILNS